MLFEKKKVIFESPDKAAWNTAKSNLKAAGIRREAYSYDAKPPVSG